MISADTIVRRLLEDEDEDDFDFKDVAYGVDNDIQYLIQKGMLNLMGSVTRESRYVHENSTTLNLDAEYIWPDDMTDEERAEREKIVDPQISALEHDLGENIIRWNRKIYRELEAFYEDSRSDEVVEGNIEANDYEFDDEGNREDDTGIHYADLDDAGKARARDWWREASAAYDDIDWSESVILEWRWLLWNKGFEGVDIGFSGFWSQGDGASFTAKHIDFERFFKFPDPLEFPEQDREQMYKESLDEAEDDDFDMKDPDISNPDFDVYIYHTFDGMETPEDEQVWEEPEGPFSTVSQAQDWAVENMHFMDKVGWAEIRVFADKQLVKTYGLTHDFQLREPAPEGGAQDADRPLVGEAEEEEEDDFDMKDLTGATAKPFGYVLVSDSNPTVPYYLTASGIRGGNNAWSRWPGDARVFKRIKTAQQWPHLRIVTVYSDPRKTGDGAFDPDYVPRKYNFGRPDPFFESEDEDDFDMKDLEDPVTAESVMAHAVRAVLAPLKESPQFINVTYDVLFTATVRGQYNGTFDEAMEAIHDLMPLLDTLPVVTHYSVDSAGPTQVYPRFWVINVIPKVSESVEEPEEEDELDAKDMDAGITPDADQQHWVFEIRTWPSWKSIHYHVVDNAPGASFRVWDRDSAGPIVGGHVFPKRTSDANLRLVAKAQIRQFKKTGYYDRNQWHSVWEWMRAARLKPGEELGNYEDWGVALPESAQPLEEGFKEKRAQWIADGHPVEGVESYLAQFRSLKDRRLITGEESDIDSYKNFGDLIVVVDRADKERLRREQERERMDREAPTIYNGPNVKIVNPKTWEASVKYGRGSRWCIAMEHDRSYWDRYTRQGNVFYFVMSKHKPPEDPTYKIAVALRNGRAMEYYNAPDSSVSREYFIAGTGIDPDTWRPFNIESVKTNPLRSYNYVTRVLGTRDQSFEPTIARSGQASYRYAVWLKARNFGNRFELGEPAILAHPQWAVPYAADILEGRWPEAEPAIMRNPQLAARYAIDVIKGRWPEAEPFIAQDIHAATDYAAEVDPGILRLAKQIAADDPATAFIYDLYERMLACDDFMITA